jgi:hypothetical protein
LGKQLLTEYARDVKNRRGGDEDETTRLFGVFEMDRMSAGLVQKAYSIFVGPIADWIAPNSYKFARDLLEKHFKPGEVALNRYSAAASFATSVGLFLLPHVGKIVEQRAKQHDDWRELLHKVAPVLDDMRGRHSLGTLMSIKAADNEMIYAHRRRLSTINNTLNFNQLLSVGVAVAPMIALSDRDTMGALYKGVHRDTYRDSRLADDYYHHLKSGKEGKNGAKNPFEDLKREDYDKALSEKNGSAIKGKYEKYRDNAIETMANERKRNLFGFGAKNWAQSTVGAITDSLKDIFVASGEAKLRRNMEACSALELVLELQEQIQDNPKASSFQPPKKSKLGHSLPLERYIEEVMKQHQRDMAQLSPEHTELRAALKEDMDAAAKVMAEAIRAGDIGALSLVRMIGEGMVIKNKGRAIASADSIEAMIEKLSGRAHTQVVTDVKEFYTKVAFTEKDLKEALPQMEPDERRIFTAFLPDEVLKKAGMSSSDIQAKHKDNAADYMHQLASVVAGIAERTDEELSKSGLARTEIRKFRQALDAIAKNGEEAIKTLARGPSNPDGIEVAVADFVMNQVKSEGRTHLGRLVREGEQALSDLDTRGKKSHAEPHRGNRDPMDEAQEKPAHHRERATKQDSYRDLARKGHDRDLFDHGARV